MRKRLSDGFTTIELVIVVAIIGLLAALSWAMFVGWRERNAVRMVSQDIKYLFEKYRQRAIDKGYNYGLVFSDDGLYVFEDNGGTGTDRFQGVNNFKIDPGEFSEMFQGPVSEDARFLRRVSSDDAEYSLFTRDNPAGTILVMTMASLNLESARNGYPYSPDGTDITSSAVVPFSGGSNAPFASGTLALFYSPDGLVYLKDPTVATTPMQQRQYRLGAQGNDSFYVVRVVYDLPGTDFAELPNYYEIAINQYGALSYIRWHATNEGTNWDAQMQ